MEDKANTLNTADEKADTLNAKEILTDLAYPTDLKAIHFGPTGDVVRIILKDDSSLPVSDRDLTAEPLQNVDLLRMYHLPVNYLLLLRGNRYKYAWKMPSCKTTGADVDIDVRGESKIEFSDDGTISKVYYPDGQVISGVTDDLMRQQISEVDFVAFRTYTLMELRNRATNQVFYRVL